MNRSFEWSLQPVVSLINSIIYRSQRLDNLRKNLQIQISFDKYYKYKGENVPKILESFIGKVVQCAQNLNILEISDPILFRMCLNFDVDFKFIDDPDLLLDRFYETLRLVEIQMKTISKEIVKRMVKLTRHQRRNNS